MNYLKLIFQLAAADHRKSWCKLEYTIKLLKQSNKHGLINATLKNKENYSIIMWFKI